MFYTKIVLVENNLIQRIYLKDDENRPFINPLIKNIL